MKSLASCLLALLCVSIMVMLAIAAIMPNLPIGVPTALGVTVAALIGRREVLS